AGSAGTYLLTLTAHNGVGSDATRIFFLLVGQGPAITSGKADTFALGQSGSFTITTSGSPAPALAVSGALQSGVTFFDNGNGTATLSGTPAAGTSGTYSLATTAANGVSSRVTQNVTLLVKDAPRIISATSTVFAVGSPSTFPVTTYGLPVSTLSESGNLPSG